MFTVSDRSKAKYLVLHFIITGVLFAFPVTGQVFINTTVSGPFYPDENINDLKAATMVTVTTTGAGSDVLYDMTLSSADNNISIHCKQLDSGYPRVLNGSTGDLDDYFNPDNVTFANDASQLAFENGLQKSRYPG